MTDVETPRSEALARRLRSSLPGGDTRTGTFYAPFPVTIERGEGWRLFDVDGREYIDCVSNFTALVHGNAHPQIVEALQEQAARGTAFPAPTALQAEVAERLCACVASVERVRFVNSGTEANLVAVRAARAFTGRDDIVKARGCYHGQWEQVAGSFAARGIPSAVAALAHEVEIGDIAALEQTMAEHGASVAALIFEPVMFAGGVIPVDAAFLAAARRLADAHGALLILDEIVTLRLHPHGGQAALGVSSDLTTFAKIIGGGLPVGAVGGRAEVMDLFDPRSEGHLVHSGTFNGNPMSLAAGRVSLDLLTPAAIDRINTLGDRLARGLRAVLTDVVVTHAGSIVQLHPGAPGPVRRPSDARLASPELTRLHRAALERGVFMAPRGMLNVSTVMDEAVVDETVARIAAAAAV